MLKNFCTCFFQYTSKLKDFQHPNFWNMSELGAPTVYIDLWVHQGSKTVQKGLDLKLAISVGRIFNDFIDEIFM